MKVSGTSVGIGAGERKDDKFVNRVIYHYNDKNCDEYLGVYYSRENHPNPESVGPKGHVIQIESLVKDPETSNSFLPVALDLHENKLEAPILHAPIAVCAGCHQNSFRVLDRRNEKEFGFSLGKVPMFPFNNLSSNSQTSYSRFGNSLPSAHLGADLVDDSDRAPKPRPLTLTKRDNSSTSLTLSDQLLTERVSVKGWLKNKSPELTVNQALDVACGVCHSVYLRRHDESVLPLQKIAAGEQVFPGLDYMRGLDNRIEALKSDSNIKSRTQASQNDSKNVSKESLGNPEVNLLDSQERAIFRFLGAGRVSSDDYAKLYSVHEMPSFKSANIELTADEGELVNQALSVLVKYNDKLSLINARDNR
jgi:hypothetical protein